MTVPAAPPAFTEAELDDMHHALGRPDGPHVKPYRNYYVLDACCAQAARMEASTGWRRKGLINSNRDSVFAVTEEGKRAVFQWLAAKQQTAGLRRYVVSVHDGEPLNVVARSAAAAKHEMFLHLADAGWCPDGYPDFIRLKPRAVLA